MSEDYAVGIDLGTTFSCIGVYRTSSSKVEIIPDGNGNRLTPSVVSYDQLSRGITVGAVASTQLRGSNPSGTIYQVKRFMGKRASDEFLINRDWPFEMLADAGGRAQIRVNHNNLKRILRPEEISAEIIKHLKVIAETYLSGRVTKAVITVPANFNDSQRLATKIAGEKADLEVLRIINEPTAAALAYGHRYFNENKERIILVYDLGGGTFDVSIVKMKGLDCEVLATEGIMELGGEDFNDRLSQEAVSQFMESGISDIDEWSLVQGCERVKLQLSSEEHAELKVMTKDESRHTINITRDLFNEICDDLFQNTISCIEGALSSARITKGHLDQVVLVGGSTRIPRVRELLREFFRDQEISFDPNHVDEAVAHGAALLASSLSNNDDLSIYSKHKAAVAALTTVTSQLSLGQNHAKGISTVGDTKPKENCVTDCIDAPMLVKLVDVCPFSLGIELYDGSMNVIIPKNTRLPVALCEPGFTNSVPHDNRIKITIYEGENRIAKLNNRLGELFIAVDRRPRGKNNINIKFTINDNGILEVEAFDLDRRERSRIQLITATLTDSSVSSDPQKIDGSSRVIQENKNRDRLERLIMRCKEEGEKMGPHLGQEHKRLAKEAWLFLSENPHASKKAYEREARRLENVLKH